MGDVNWTNDDVIRLVQEYRKKRELWDSTHELYRVATVKYEVWSELANMFGCDIADLRKKCNSIFASYRREKSKVRCGGISTWFLYPYLSFLPNHLENNEKDPDDRQNQRENDEEQSSEDNQEMYQEQIIVKQEATEPSRRSLLRSALHQKNRLTKTIRRRFIPKETSNTSQTLDTKLIEALRLLRKSEHVTRKKDEIDSFGEYIADSLRKHDERTQSMIKQAINNILFEQEMKKYSVGQYATVVIANMDENPLILGDTDSQEDINK